MGPRVILDLTLPGQPGGVEVMAQLRRLDPNVVAIVASGYADNGILAEHNKHGFQVCLAKPFDLSSISAELARVLKPEARD